VLGARVACSLGRHADDLAGDKLVALPLGLLHRPAMNSSAVMRAGFVTLKLGP